MRWLPWLPWLALGAAALQSAGCMAMDDGENSGISDSTDIFPRPIGERMIPLELEATASFRFVETGGNGEVRMDIPDLQLFIRKRSGGAYAYAFEDISRGFLVAFKTHPDSLGVWIVGTFRGGEDSFHAQPILWLPQNPVVGASWETGPGRTMSLASADTAYLTEVLSTSDDKAPISQGFQRHRAYMFRETSGDTVTVYHFRKGVGCLGLERSVGGRLLAAGTLRSLRATVRP